MPRRQRFKPSRKPKPAIELSESDIIIPVSKPVESSSPPPPSQEDEPRRDEVTP